MIQKINIKFPEEFTITSVTTNKSDLSVTLKNNYVPKDGDIVYTKGNRIQYGNKLLSSIGIFKEIKDDKIYCHCELFLENHRLVRYPYPQDLEYNQIIRSATKNQITLLFENMEDSKLTFDNINKTLIKTYEPKDGDFVFNQTGSDSIVIFKKIIENKVSTYCSLFNKSNNLFITRNDYFTDISNFKPRLATEEEKETLVNKLKEGGLKWNAETKTLEKSYLPKVNDICIVWSYKSHAIIGKVIDICNNVYIVGDEKYENCIKFESMEQYYGILNSQK